MTRSHPTGDARKATRQEAIGPVGDTSLPTEGFPARESATADERIAQLAAEAERADQERRDALRHLAHLALRKRAAVGAGTASSPPLDDRILEAVGQRDSLTALDRHHRIAGRLGAWRGTPRQRLVLARALIANRMLDAAWYRTTQMPAGSLLPPMVHFLSVGIREELAPHPLMDPAWYRAQRGDRIPSGRPAIVDYLIDGATTAACPHALFDTRYYLEQAPHLRITRQPPLGHYLTEGHTVGLDPSPLFDTAWYRSQEPDGLGPDEPALVHYLRADAGQRATPHRLFDAAGYVARHPDVLASGLDPLVHYARSGGREGRTPHPAFDGAWFIQHYAERDPLRSPLACYLAEGERAGCWPNPLFDPAWYREQNGEQIAPYGSALAHYWAVGREERRWPNALFDPQWYLDTYPDVRGAGLDPVEHYAHTGEREGRRPNPYFDPAWYAAEHADVSGGGGSPLHHYLSVGQFDGRRPSADFDPASYLAANPVLALDGVAPFAHYVRLGAKEQRPVRPQFGEIGLFGGKSDAGPAGDGAAIDLPRHMALDPADGAWEWRAHAELKARLAAAERRRIEQLALSAPALVRIEEADLQAAAGRLAFADEAQPLVSILIPVYNNISLTLECLASIARSGASVGFEVIVADDASSDETASIISSLPGVRHVRQPANLNFLRNCNAAAQTARGRYLVILNNDAQVTPGWLDALVEAFQSTAGVGAVGPRFIYPNGRLQEAGAILNTDGTTSMIGLFDDPALPRYNYRREVDYCSGACLLVETERFRRMGGFSDDLAPAYCEDADLCLRLRQDGLKILYEPAALVIHHLSKTTAATDDTFKMRAVARNQHKLVTRWRAEIDRLNEVRLLAFFLPQFHPIAENDRWWGKGFTEWRNVAKAVPNFVGHYQPRRPADLGYYDLRLPEVMEQQAALARRYGISGFCYYYYWFAGHRLLERPLETMLATGRPDMPFCLCWANENWTRTWDGESSSILIAQQHSREDDLAVIADLARYFRSPSYIRIDGRPLLLVYRVGLFPDFAATARLWRDYCREAGLGEIYLAMVESFEQVRGEATPQTFGCDAGVEFPPHGFGDLRRPVQPLLNPAFEGVSDDYTKLVQRYLERPLPGYTRFRGVLAGWDNTPRRQDNSIVFERATPGAFQAWLEAVIQQTREQAHAEERIVFINAWNEWAEGAYLEPDMRFGHTWLEAVANARDACRIAR